MGVFMRDRSSLPVVASAAPVVRAEPQSGRAQAPAYNKLRAFTASAERIEISGLGVPVQRPFSAWQGEAWTGYERIGEVHYGFNLLANLLTRVRLYAGVVGEPNEAPVDAAKAAKDNRVDPKLAAAAQAAVDDLLSEDGPGMVRSFSLNFSVPGECYLIHLPQKDGTKVWTIRSVDEILVTATGIKLVPMRGQSQEIKELPKDTFIARMWRQNPRYSREPDSSMVGVLGPIKTLLLIDRLTDGAILSRLNAGMLFVPDGISGGLSATHTPEPTVENSGTIEDLQAQVVSDPSGEFMAELLESMSAPIADESSAAALVPMLVQGPADQGEKIRHITFERPSDEWLVNQAASKLERILNGIDIPKEIVTGLQAVKYSNAVVIDENLYKSNIEPLALALADALTTVYLRAILKAQGFQDSEIRKVVIWYDPSEIVTRPNAADDATEGVDRGLLSGAAWRREHGFAESDAPTKEDLLNQLITKVAALPDNVLQAVFKEVLGDILDIEESTDTDNGGARVLKFRTGTAPAAPDADPQRTAVQQVGQT